MVELLFWLIPSPPFDLTDLAILKGQLPSFYLKFIMALPGQPEDHAVKLAVNAELTLMAGVVAEHLTGNAAAIANVPSSKRMKRDAPVRLHGLNSNRSYSN